MEISSYSCPFHKHPIPCQEKGCKWKFSTSGKLIQITNGKANNKGTRHWKTICGGVTFLSYPDGNCKVTGGSLLQLGNEEHLAYYIQMWFLRRRVLYKKIGKKKGCWIIEKIISKSELIEMNVLNYK